MRCAGGQEGPATRERRRLTSRLSVQAASAGRFTGPARGLEDRVLENRGSVQVASVLALRRRAALNFMHSSPFKLCGLVAF